MLKSPSPLDTASKDTPESFLTTTAAPEIAPPAESSTAPVIDEVAACPEARALARTTSETHVHTCTSSRFIKAPPSLIRERPIAAPYAGARARSTALCCAHAARTRARHRRDLFSACDPGAGARSATCRACDGLP